MKCDNSSMHGKGWGSSACRCYCDLHCHTNTSTTQGWLGWPRQELHCHVPVTGDTAAAPSTLGRALCALPTVTQLGYILYFQSFFSNISPFSPSGFPNQCLLLARMQNSIVTSSYYLPSQTPYLDTSEDESLVCTSPSMPLHPLLSPW